MFQENQEASISVDPYIERVPTFAFVRLSLPASWAQLCFLMSARNICLGLGVVAVLWFAGYHQRRRSRLPLPPGPPKLPVIGHLLELPGPGTPLWETWAEWSEKYSTSSLPLQPTNSMLTISGRERCDPY